LRERRHERPPARRHHRRDPAVLPATAISTIIAADEGGILAAIAAKVAAFKPDISTPRLGAIKGF
jgi:hypothetical protein